MKKRLFSGFLAILLAVSLTVQLAAPARAEGAEPDPSGYATQEDGSGEEILPPEDGDSSEEPALEGGEPVQPNSAPLEFSGEGVAIDETNFPNDNFRKYVQNTIAGGGTVLTDEMVQATVEMNLSGQGIFDLTGIEHFTYLQSLTCGSGNDLWWAPDFSGNMALKYLDLRASGLTNLSLTNNPNLETLYCGSNQIHSLDLSGCPALKYLDCSQSELTKLDLSNNTALETLYCQESQLRWLDLESNTALSTVNVGGQKSGLNANMQGNGTALASALDMLSGEQRDQWGQLGSRIAFDSQSLALNDVVYDPVTGTLTLNNVTGVLPRTVLCTVSLGEIGGAPAYMDVELQLWPVGLEIEAVPLDADHFPDPVFLNYLQSNILPGEDKLTTDNVRRVDALRLYGMGVTDLTGLEYLPYLLHLDVGNNALTELDVSGNPLLTELICGNNDLTELDVSGNPLLKWLICDDNQLAALDISANPLLTSLGLSGNCLAWMDLEGRVFSGYATLQNQSISLMVETGGTGTAVVDLKALMGLDAAGWAAVSGNVHQNGYASNMSYDAETGILTVTGLSNPSPKYFSYLVDTGGIVDSRYYSGSLEPVKMYVTLVIMAGDVGLTQPIAIDAAHFPDPAFRAYVKETIAGGSDTLTPEVAKAVTQIDIAGLGVTDLTGINCFAYLEELDCSGNSLAALDLAGNALLKRLDCSGNSLAALEITHLSGLTWLDCSQNALVALEVYSHSHSVYPSGLSYLDVSDNRLSALSVESLYRLSHLDCSNNRLLTIGLPYSYSQLKELDCSGNLLTGLSLNNAEFLTKVDCSNNRIAGIFGNLPALEELRCQNNQLSELTHNMEPLRYLDCSGNQLMYLYLGADIREVYCSDNRLLAIYFAKPADGTVLEALDCSGNRLTWMDLTCFARVNNAVLGRQVAPWTLYTEGAGTGSLPLTTYLSGVQREPGEIYNPITQNPITFGEGQLDAAQASFGAGGMLSFANLVGGQTRRLGYTIHTGDAVYATDQPGAPVALEVTLEVTVDATLPVAINEENFPDPAFRAYIKQCMNGADTVPPDRQKETLGMYPPRDSEIASLKGIEFFPNLISLWVANSQVAELDLSGNTGLVGLYITGSRLTELDVSGLPNLEQLECYDNQLTSLVLGENPNLNTLYCHNNQLTELDLTGLPALTELICHNNQLTGLDLSCQNDMYNFAITPQFADLYVSAKDGYVMLDMAALLGMTHAQWSAYEEPLLLDEDALRPILEDYDPATGVLRLKAGAMGTAATFTYRGTTGYFGTTSNHTGYKMMQVVLTVHLDTTGALAVDARNFPDAAFRGYVHDVLSGGSGVLTQDMLQVVTEIDLPAAGITDVQNLTGVELFPNLKRLNARGNQLGALNLSGNPALEWLDVGDNQLTALDLSGNLRLTTLYCAGNKIGYLDLEGHTLTAGVLGPQLFEVAVADLDTYPGHIELTGALGLSLQQLEGIFFLNNSSYPYDKATGRLSVDWEGTGTTSIWLALPTGAEAVSFVSDRLDILLTVHWPDVGEGRSVSVDRSSFPDPVLRSWLLANLADENGAIGDVGNISQLNLSGLGITDIRGLDQFYALKELNLSDNSLLMFDNSLLHNIPSLKKLDLSSNPLPRLTVTEYSGLTHLNLSGNDLDTLDLSRMPMLESLDVSGNSLTMLDITGSSWLAQLDCSGNLLETLNLSGNPVLQSISCGDNRLPMLDLSHNLMVTECLPSPQRPSTWTCTGGQSTSSIEMSELLGIPVDSWEMLGDPLLHFWASDLNAANASYRKSDGRLSLYGLTGVDSRVFAYTVHVGNTPGERPGMKVELTIRIDHTFSLSESRDFPDAAFRKYIVDELCGGNSDRLFDMRLTLTEMDVSGRGIANLKGIELFPNLRVLNCGNNKLTSLDLSRNTQLVELYCAGNKLTSLDLSKHAELTRLGCSGNQLTHLDLTDNPRLYLLQAGNNKLAGLDLSGNPRLGYLDAPNNQLQTVDLSGNTRLTSVALMNNPLTAVDFSSNPRVNLLDVRGGKLQSIDLSAVEDLDFLYIQNNLLTELDLSGNRKLRYLECQDNRIQSLILAEGQSTDALILRNNQLVDIDGQYFTAQVSGQTRTVQVAAGNTAGAVYDLKALVGQTLDAWQADARIQRVEIPEALQDTMAYNKTTGMVYVARTSAGQPLTLTYWLDTVNGEMDVTLTLEFTQDVPPVMTLAERFIVNEGLLQGLLPGTTAAQLDSQITETVTFLAADDTPLPEGAALGTGAKVVSGDTTYTVLLLGDTTGDGYVNITDLLLVRGHLLNLNALQDIYLQAGAAGSEEPDAASVLSLRRQILAQEDIPQFTFDG